MQTITELRLKKGMTQEELASATGVSLRTIQRIELGTVQPRAYSLRKIAEALQVDFSELYQPAMHPQQGLYSFFKAGTKTNFIQLFYTCWMVIVILLLLLNITSEVLGSRFLNSSLLFENDFHISRVIITLALVFALMQVYLLQFRKHLLSAASYWVMLALFSALTMYLKYSHDFVSPSFLALNSIQLYGSFICWLMLLFIGVTYKPLFTAAAAKTSLA